MKFAFGILVSSIVVLFGCSKPSDSVEKSDQTQTTTVAVKSVKPGGTISGTSEPGLAKSTPVPNKPEGTPPTSVAGPKEVAGSTKTIKPVVAPTAKPAVVSGPLASIAGKYKGEMNTRPKGKDDPGSKMGEAMMKMFGSSSLEIADKGDFTLKVMGIPIEGKVALSGKNLTLNPTTFAGMTKEEAMKLSKERQTDTGPMKGFVAADGKIHITEKGSGEMVFTRAKAEPAKPIVSTVRPDEQRYTGIWAGTMNVPEKAGMTDEQAAQMRAAKSMLKNLSLDLRPDNTFLLNMFMELEGKWTAKAGKVILTPTKIMGMSVDEMTKQGGGMASSANQPMAGSISADGRTLVFDGKGAGPGKLTFHKK